jgi:hypothetical protein
MKITAGNKVTLPNLYFSGTCGIPQASSNPKPMEGIYDSDPPSHKQISVLSHELESTLS